MTVSVYTDGACSGLIGGWAWVLASPDGRGGIQVDAADSGTELATTNNRMELVAVIEALKSIPLGAGLRVVTDSAYVANCFLERWYDRWRSNGWRTGKNRPVENQDLWEELLALAEARAAATDWTHVRGHGKRSSDDPIDVLGNAEADRLAVMARTTFANAAKSLEVTAEAVESAAEPLPSVRELLARWDASSNPIFLSAAGQLRVALRRDGYNETAEVRT